MDSLLQERPEPQKPFFDPREQPVPLPEYPQTPETIATARRNAAEEAIRAEHSDLRRLSGFEAVKVLVAEFGPKTVHGWLYNAAALEGKELPCKRGF